MVLQKIIFQIVLDNKDIDFVLFVLNIIYMVLRRGAAALLKKQRKGK